MVIYNACYVMLCYAMLCYVMLCYIHVSLYCPGTGTDTPLGTKLFRKHKYFVNLVMWLSVSHLITLL